MATYSTYLKLLKPAQGENSPAWASTFNAGATELSDDAIDGLQDINLASSTSYSLAAMTSGADTETRARTLRFNGTPASAATVTVPASVTSKHYTVINNCGQTLTLKYAATTGRDFANGAIGEVYCDGVTVLQTNALTERTAAEIAAGVTPTNYAYAPGNVLRYGTNTTPGTTDMTAAFQAIINTKQLGFVPFGDYKVIGNLTFSEGGIIGEGYGTSGSAKRSRLYFYNCTSLTQGAINTRQSGAQGNKVLFKDLEVRSSSWDGATGCLGYGFDIEAPVIMENVYVVGFKKSNVWFHHSSGSAGPYNSTIINVQSNYSGVHGFLIGYGANVLYFESIYAAYSGAPSYGTAPSGAGTGDGFHVEATADGGGYPAYTPNAVTVINGNCSYNAGYGWNIDTTDGSFMSPGYAEGNFTNQARIGNILNTCVDFQHLNGNTTGLTNSQSFAPYYYRNKVLIGGKQVHPVNFYDFIANPAAEDEASGTIQNASSRQLFLARSNTAAHLCYLYQNVAPEGTTATLASEAIVTLGGSGTFAIGIGSGSRHLKITAGIVRLPDIWYQGTTASWTAATVARGMGSAAPVAGTWTRGDIIFDTAPAASGTIGWVCVTAGTPGTWKTFGAISA